ncbi:unnamed protein product, partial [Discosporangium mesarthrocarpum]
GFRDAKRGPTYPPTEKCVSPREEKEIVSMQQDQVWSFTAGGKPSRKQSRFNLLALEHGEYYFQDYSAYYFPPSLASPPASSSPFSGEGGGGRRPRQQGRLKLCSRGLLFEPADRQ